MEGKPINLRKFSLNKFLQWGIQNKEVKALFGKFPKNFGNPQKGFQRRAYQPLRSFQTQC